MKLITKRLILRDLTKKDAKDIVSNANNIRISRYLLVVPYPYKLKDAKEWIKDCIKKAKERPRKDYTFGIELKSEKKIIGAIGVHHIDKYSRKAGVGYWLGEKYWKQGIMSEALKKILDFAFSKLKLRRLEAEVFIENEPSYSLLEKFGFKREGMKKESERAKSTGKIHDSYCYGLLKKRYRK